MFIAGVVIDQGQLATISGIPDSATYLQHRSRDVQHGVLPNGIADDECASVLVEEIAPFKTGRSVEVDGLNRIAR